MSTSHSARQVFDLPEPASLVVSIASTTACASAAEYAPFRGSRSASHMLPYSDTGGHDCAQAIIATFRALFQALFAMVATASRCARVVRGEIMGWGP
jgi:hypothetical protein